MSKKEEFKEFAKENKYLIKLVQEGKTTWQKLYETYDIYGKNSDIWNTYKDTREENNKSSADSIKSIIGNLKNIDMDKLEENISSLQKALGFLEEIVVSRTEKKEVKKEKKKKNIEIERFFDD